MLSVQVFQPRAGEPVLYEGRRFYVQDILDLNRCILQPDLPNGRRIAADISALRPVPEAIPSKDTIEGQGLEDIPEKHLDIALRRLEIIRPLVDASTWPQIEQSASANGMHPTTLWRWLKEFRRTGMFASLVPEYRRRGAPLKSRLSEEQEAAILEAVEYYLTEERPEVKSAHAELKAICRTKGLRAPSLSTLHNRLKAKSQRLVTRARKGKNAARALDLVRGGLPGADGPWSIILIDHTPLDIILLDRQTRRPLGRAYITVAIDAATRMIVGFYISLDNPSALSVGLCVARAMLPKEAWLERLGVKGQWPVWGTPKVVHVDNGDGFRSEAVKRACKELGFDIYFRRVGHPQDGGMVERFLLTLARKLHQLPGTTFSNPQERGDYDSEKKAVLTMDELERYIAEWIVNEYHQSPHRGLDGKPPIQAWEEGLLGGHGLPGLGLPVRHVDEQYILLRFLPFESRTIQKDGLAMWRITYWSDHLRRWVKAKEPDNERISRKFIVRYDPRDISRVWFHDPKLKDYIEVSCRQITRPAISLWEWNKVQEYLQEKGVKKPNEELIFSTRENLRQIVAQGTADTKAVRREREREQRRREATARAPSKTPPQTRPEKLSEGWVDPRTLAYDDIEN